jgi:hypothetical protein
MALDDPWHAAVPHPEVALPVIPLEYANTVADPSTVAHAEASAKKLLFFMRRIVSSFDDVAQ